MQEKNINGSTFQEFSWVLQRLAAMQGTSIDTQQLQVVENSITGATEPLKELQRICRLMGLPSPRYPKHPDRVHLPLLCYTSEHHWALVVDRNPQGEWILVKPSGQSTVSGDKLIGRIAALSLSTRTSLAWRLMRTTSSRPTFFDHIRAALLLYKKELVEASIGSAFIGILALATSLFSMQVYDRVIPTRSEHTLIVLSIGVALTILIELVMKLTRSHIMDHVVIGMDSRLSREVFNRLLQLRVDQIPASVGSLAGQLRGYEHLRNFYTATTLFTLIDVPLAIGFLLLIMWIATPWVALVPAIAAALVLYIGASMRSQTQLHSKQNAALSNMKTGLLVEAVEGMETIKAGSGGWKFLSRWIDVNSTTIETDLKMRRISEGANYWIAAIQQVSYAGLIATGALVVMRGDMTMGALIACSILSGRILAPIMSLPNLMLQHAHAQAALDGIERIYTLKADQDDVEIPIAPEQIYGQYRLEGVKFSYADNPPSLCISKLAIEPGERVAVIGPIGAGKSTLLRLLSGLYHPQEGRILLDDLDISHIKRQALNQHIGYLQQDHRLFHGTLRENLLIGMPDPGDEAILQAMRRTGMDQFVSAHPKGLSRQISEGGKGLSGGQKQLVAFTRLVLCNPSILLLDEPTATMDEEQERKCLQVLQQVAQSRRTLVVVTHKPSLLALVDRIILIAGNQIVLDGPRDAVLKQLQARPTANNVSAQSAQQVTANPTAA